jgi:3-mercaptopyruvate sulfurtransferase SseA
VLSKTASEKAFPAAVSALGIYNKDEIVVYDGKGLFSAAHVWYLSYSALLLTLLNWSLGV